MLFSKLSEYFEKLEKTASKLEMTSILADLLSKASPLEVDKICYLSLGRLAPLFESVEFNIAEKLMIKILSRAYGVEDEEVKRLFGELGDLGDVAEKLATQITQKKKDYTDGLSVSEVFGRLYKIATTAGAGSVEQKTRSFAKLLSQLNPLSAKYVTRIPLKKLRLGFADKTILDALSWMETGGKSLRIPLERAYNACPDIGEIARRFREKGLKGIKGIKIRVGGPILPQLCQRVKTAKEILEKMGGEAAAEPKFDGERIQLHLDRRQAASSTQQTTLEGFEGPKFLIKAFTRNLEEVSSMFPDLLEAADKQIKASSAILDGETVGVDVKTGRFVPFQVTVQRKRKYRIREKAAEIPLKLFVFDVLYKDGESLLERPFAERRKILEEVILNGRFDHRGHRKAQRGKGGAESQVEVAPQRIIRDPQKLDEFLQESVKEGLEGLVVKKLDASYEAGARGFSWVKFKGEKDTFDCVVLGYNFGKGKRIAFGISAFLVGVYDKEGDTFKTVSKIGTGLTDKQWREMKKRCDKLKVRGKPARVDVPKELVPNVWVDSSMVVAVRADEITKSPLHSSGYALRFPRLISWRDDKSAEDATAVKEIREMYKLQK